MDQIRHDRPLLDVRLDDDDKRPTVSSDDMKKAIEDTKREIQQAFGDMTRVEASTKSK